MTDYTIDMTETYLRRRIYEIRLEAERQAKPYLDQLVRIEARKQKSYYVMANQFVVDQSNNICISGTGSSTEREDGESQGKAS